MASLTFKNNPIKTLGNFPNVGEIAPNFTVVSADLTEVSLAELKGKKIILNIFPSIDTPVCALQLKTFSQGASGLDNTVLLFVSLDLPFAFSRFCSAEGIKNAITASDYRYRFFEKNYGVTISGGPLDGLYARAVLILDEQHKIVYSELVKEVTDEPNYDKAMDAL